MTTHRLFYIALITTAFACIDSPNATAQSSCTGLFDQHAFGINRLHANARILPYFALYPPVYYSQSVPRPYGYSPFALPPGTKPVEPVESAEDKSEEIINPYYRPNEDSKAIDVTDEVAIKSQMIVNPFVPQSTVPAQQKLAKVSTTRRSSKK